MRVTTKTRARVVMAFVLAVSIEAIPGCGSPGQRPIGTGLPDFGGPRQGTALDVLAAAAASLPGPRAEAPREPTAGGEDALESTGDGMAVRCVTASGWEDIVVSHGEHSVVSTCELMNGETCTCDPEPE